MKYQDSGEPPLDMVQIASYSSCSQTGLLIVYRYLIQSQMQDANKLLQMENSCEFHF